MTELLKELTLLVIQARIRLTHLNGLPAPIAAAESAAAEPAPKKERKARAPKEEKSPEPVAVSVAATPAPVLPTQTEEESLKEIQMVARTYVQRFGNMKDGIAAWRKLQLELCGVARLDDLVHAQRLTVIAAAKMELQQADTGGAVASASAGVEV